ncbi:MAG: hypothetical protein KF819_27905 [Labilithrix sp.]|nr:hypothetical protein [Labilithrix sp.]
MLWFMLLHEELRAWEQRIGAWQARCQGCHRDAWQLTFRIWRTKGTAMSPATPYGMAYGECHQVRCSGCGVATNVGHPTQWVPQIGPAYTYENHPPVYATPQYLQLAFPAFR